MYISFSEVVRMLVSELIHIRFVVFWGLELATSVKNLKEGRTSGGWLFKEFVFCVVCGVFKLIISPLHHPVLVK